MSWGDRVFAPFLQGEEGSAKSFSCLSYRFHVQICLGHVHFSNIYIYMIDIVILWDGSFMCHHIFTMKIPWPLTGWYSMAMENNPFTLCKYKPLCMVDFQWWFHVYIYIYVLIYIYIYVYICILYVYMYIYIYIHKMGRHHV